jgi:hypothetical protein
MNKRFPLTTPGQPSISFRKWVSIAQAGAVVLSPDGVNIAYTVTTTEPSAGFRIRAARDRSDL